MSENYRIKRAEEALDLYALIAREFKMDNLESELQELAFEQSTPVEYFRRI